MDRTLELVVQVVVTGAVGLLGWSLRQTLRDVRDKLNQVATDVRQLSATTGAHAERLAGGDVRLAELARRVDGLEERERYAVRARGPADGC